MPSKTDFANFAIGTVFNDAIVTGTVKPPLNSIKISYPSRLEAMALDPGKIADNNNLIYKAGQIDFCVALYKDIKVTIDTQSADITVSDRTPRKALVLHAALIMRQALGFEDGLKIDVFDAVDLRHCGLGSSSSLIAGTAAAINELFGTPITPLNLVRYCAQNHGEEINGSKNTLVPVQCIGGSGVCGHFEGGLVILSGEATPIMTERLPEELLVVFGVPADFEHLDSQELMNAEIENIAGFKASGDEFGPLIAYRLIHEAMPGIAEGNLKPMKDLIFDYRWDMGSIKNCSFVYPRMNEIAESLRPLRDDDDVAIIALSSVGPGFFALTSNPDKVEAEFQKLGLNTYVTSIHNGKYIVNSKEK
jgi:predicted sugar kinase